MLAPIIAAVLTAAAQQEERFTGMTAAPLTGFRAFALATVAGLALTGAAIAQKPAPLGAPGAAPAAPSLPTAKPPPLGGAAPAPAPPPLQMLPLPRRTPPGVTQAPAAPTPPSSLPAPQAIPPNEPAAITRLRGLLGRETRLSYAAAEAQDATGEQARMTGVVLERPGKRVTMDEVTLMGLRQDGVAETVIRGFATTEDGNTVRIGMLRIAGLTVPRTAAGAPPQPDDVTLDSLRLENLRVTGGANVAVNLVTVEGWGANRPARLTVEGVESTGLDGGFVDGLRIARIGMSGMDIARMLGALMREERVPSLVGQTSLEMTGLQLTGGGRPVGGIAEFRIAGDITATDGSGTGTVAVRGIRVEPVPMIGEWLTRFGYQAIEGEITASTAHDGKTGRVEVRDLSIGARDAGTLTMSVTLDGLTSERMQAADFSQARLISAALGYADASLFRRFLAMQSRETRTPEAQLREQYAAMAGGALSQPDAAALAPVRDALVRFIRGQAQAVDIRVNPPQPIGLEEMQQVPPSPAEMQRVLGITATTR